MARFTTCSSCGASIVFLRTATGKSNPVNADTVRAGDDMLDVTRHVSHFATCPNSATHRNPR